MIALEVSLNGQRLCLAGAEDLAVLHAIIGASGNLGKLTNHMRDEPPDISLRVGGLTSRKDASDEHLYWVDFLNLEFGDEVTVRLQETDSPDPAKRSSPCDEERRKQKKREEWEYAREYYFMFKEEFESE